MQATECSLKHKTVLTGLTLFFVVVLKFFWPHHATGGILVPQPEIEPVPPSVEAQS